MEFQIPIRTAKQAPPQSGHLVGSPDDHTSGMTLQMPLRPAREATLQHNEQTAPPANHAISKSPMEDDVIEKLAHSHALLMEKSAWYRSAWRKRSTEGGKQIELDLDFGVSSGTWHLLIKWLRTGKVVTKSSESDVLSLYSENCNDLTGTQNFDDAYQIEEAEYTAHDEEDGIDYEYEEGPIAAEVHLDLADEYRRMIEAGAHLNPKNEDHAEAFIIGRHFPDHFSRGIRRASQLDAYQLSILIKLLHDPSYAADYPKRFVHLLAEILQARLPVNAIHKSDHQNVNATAGNENDEFVQLIDLAILADRLQIIESLRSEILKKLDSHHVWRVALGSGYLPSAEVTCKAFEALGPRSSICDAIVCMYAREWQYDDRSLGFVEADGRFTDKFLEEVVKVMERFDKVDEDVACEEMDEMEIDGMEC